MIKSLQQRILWFILLVLVQVAILNHIYFLGYINPMLYILFIILYPLRKEKASFLILSFLLGLTTYIATLTFIHHFIIFSLSYFNWGDITTILYRTFTTGIFTIILCVFTIALFIKKK